MDKKALIKALRDTAQSASNTIASGVSAPVDLIAAGLRKMGVPVPENALGGSRWMEDVGLTVPVQEGIPKTVGETLGMIVPMAATAKAPQIAAGANRAIENAMAPATLNTPGFAGQRGAIVWHGSPHKFDRFDASKIGTGEGAQAYGHGLYFAESPETAKAYRDTLSKAEKQFYIKGNRVEPEMLNAFESNVLNAKSYGRNKQDYLEELELNRVPPGAIQKISKVWDEMGDVTIKDVFPENASLYKVDLPDEAIAKMLDWDKPLSQQAPEVQKLEALQGFLPDETGAEMYRILSKELAGGSQFAQGKADAAADILRQQGIPGIRYLDQGSRGAGAGTSNFVVFPGNENMLRILERNNQPLGLMGIK